MLLTLAASSAQAEIYKCKEPNGATVFTGV
ncbi:MAG: DUF4124 domain-containing protein, partial [Azoarcus sp.]|nr:DUF4124 domain-containing protein [Azoarcus sp.]